MTSLLPDSNESLPAEHWGALAFDLVLRAAPLETILETFNITSDTLKSLLANPNFKATIEDAKAQVKQYGAEAGFVLRARTLCEDLMPDMYRIAKDPTTDPKQRESIFNSFARYGLLDPSTNKKQTADTGVKVVFNLGAGVRGMEHIIPAQIVTTHTSNDQGE